MSRYKNRRIKKTTKDGKVKSYYVTQYLPKKVIRDSDVYLIAQEGDRCDNLARKFYGDSKKWYVIARANSLNTMNIPAGTTLRIPR